MTLREQIAAANKKAGLDRQRQFGKKTVVRQTADQIIDLLTERANDVAAAFFKNQGDLGQAVRSLQQAVAIAGKRVR